MKLFIFGLLFFSSSILSQEFTYKGSFQGYKTSYFNGYIEDLAQNSWRFIAHDNEQCINSERNGCRKVGVQIDKGVFNFKARRNYSFDFKINDDQNAPEWLIVFQDWVLLQPNDTNGNHPITTIKVRRFSGQLYLQHWENSWQFKPWNFLPEDPYDEQHTHGLEVMRGEYKIQAGQMYSVSLDIHDRGWASLSVDGVRVSDADYRTSSYSDNHINYFGMYYSKGFNKPVNYETEYSIEIRDLTYKVEL